MVETLKALHATAEAALSDFYVSHGVFAFNDSGEFTYEATEAEAAELSALHAAVSVAYAAGVKATGHRFPNV